MKVRLELRHVPIATQQAEFIAALRDLFDEYRPVLNESRIRFQVVSDLVPYAHVRQVADIVIDYVAIAYDVDPDKVAQRERKCRHKRVTEARHLAMLFVSGFTNMPDQFVADLFDADRAMLNYVRKWTSELCEVHEGFRLNLAKMREELSKLIATARAENPLAAFDALTNRHGDRRAAIPSPSGRGQGEGPGTQSSAPTRRALSPQHSAKR